MTPQCHIVVHDVGNVVSLDSSCEYYLRPDCVVNNPPIRNITDAPAGALIVSLLPDSINIRPDDPGSLTTLTPAGNVIFTFVSGAISISVCVSVGVSAESAATSVAASSSALLNFVRSGLVPVVSFPPTQWARMLRDDIDAAAASHAHAVYPRVIAELEADSE